MPNKPIIIIKKISGHGGHHGGSWKVAYADFVTAMMALFIVLWLLNSSVKVKKAVAGYFNDPRSSQKETGTTKTGDDDAVPINKQNVEKLKEQIQKAIDQQKNLEKLAKQIELTITPEGLRIELIEDKNGTFFQSGSAKLSDSGQQLLEMLAGQLKPLPNRLLLEGHTDAQPYSTGNGYTNWELSADRANSARRLLQQDGVGQDQISQVRGYADQLLRVKTDPFDPSNRRVSIIVQWQEGAPTATEQVKPGEQAKLPAGGTEPAKAGATGKAASEKAGPEKAGAETAGTAKPSAGKPPDSTPAAAKGSTTAPVPDKAGILDKLKRMLPADKSKKN